MRVTIRWKVCLHPPAAPDRAGSFLPAGKLCGARLLRWRGIFAGGLSFAGAAEEKAEPGSSGLAAELEPGIGRTVVDGDEFEAAAQNSVKKNPFQAASEH